jgi:hypothetical protein
VQLIVARHATHESHSRLRRNCESFDKHRYIAES